MCNQKFYQSGSFFPKSGHFFWFSKRAGEASPLPFSFTPRVWLNMYQYPWISPNILENAWINCWLCQGSEYARSSDMFDKLLKVAWVLNKPKGCAEFQICLIMAPYTSIMPEYALMFLNMFEHDWILLTAPEYAWKNCPDYVRVLNMPQCSYNNIIIANVILESLPAPIIHPGTLLPFYHFNTS